MPAAQGLLRKTSVFLEMIKFSHSVFALPFALLAMLVAAGGWPGPATVALILVAVVGARTAAMCFNRIADRDVDAENPRTANRALVTGELDTRFAWVALVVSLAVFYVAAGLLNPLCLLLATPCMAVLLGYSWMKRVTDYSHFVLGAALGLAPIGAWVAVRGELAWFPALLGVAVTLWVAGFDVLYSCQDYDYDREAEGLHSIPKRLGLAGAMAFARRLHGAALLAFVGGWALGMPMLGALTLAGVAGVGGLVMYQHSRVSPADLSRIDAAFFTTNGMISLGLFLIVWADVALG